MDIKLCAEKSIIDKTIEKYIPRKYTPRHFITMLGMSGFDPLSADKAIAEPIWEFLDRGGKRWRPAFFMLVLEALGSDPKEFLDFAVIPELIHNGSIIIDDIEDGSELRRGKPCTYRKYGLDIAVNVGSALHSLPMLAVMHNKQIDDKIKAKIYEVCFLEMARLHFGQGADIVWHRGLVDADKITEEKYLQMCACKTGALVRLTAKLAAILAGARQDVMDKIGNFAESIGVAFQIRDDILNLGTGKFVERKGYGDDITEGKMTLLVIHTLKKANAKDRKRLVEILRAKTRDKVLIEEGIGIIKKYDSFEYAERVASKLVAKAWEDVEKVLPDSSAKEKLRMLAQYLIKRDI